VLLLNKINITNDIIKFITLAVNAIVLAYISEFFLYEPMLATIIVPNTGIVIKEDNNIYNIKNLRSNFYVTYVNVFHGLIITNTSNNEKTLLMFFFTLLTIIIIGVRYYSCLFTILFAYIINF
jgi:hypothetical protein